MSLTLGKTTFLYAFIATLKDGRQVGAIAEAATEDAAILAFRSNLQVASVAPLQIKNDHLGSEYVGSATPLDLARQHFTNAKMQESNFASKL